MLIQKRLLIIEDDIGLTLALYRALSHTYKVDTAKTGQSGITKALNLPLDLIILDLNLPDINGIKVIKHLRQAGVGVPVLVLSGESGLISKVNLLDSGASDYVIKPFSLAELNARIRALLRQNYYPTKSVLVSSDLVLDPNLRKVTYKGSDLGLRRKEFLLLECLMRNPGKAVSRTYLYTYVWGARGSLSNNSIDVHIKSLRDKIGPEGHDMVTTVHGLGYCFNYSKPKVRI